MPATETAWAEPSDVELYTGATATEAELAQAQVLVELFAGTTIIASNSGNISGTNERHLMLAVCYQTAWMQVHPDVYTSVDADSYSGDGASFQPSHVNAHLLAPLAKRHLDRLTWSRRPLRARPRFGTWDDQAQPLSGGRDSAAADDDANWAPM